MKRTTMKSVTLTLSVILALALVWMGFLMVTASPLAMTCIPAAAVCGICAVGIAKVDEKKQEAARQDRRDAAPQHRAA